VTRDVGLIGSGCFLGILIDSTLAAKFDPAEAATFYVEPGEHLAAPTVIGGRGLCGAFYSE
jgi:hypothetical protein